MMLAVPDNLWCEKSFSTIDVITFNLLTFPVVHQVYDHVLRSLLLSNPFELYQ